MKKHFFILSFVILILIIGCDKNEVLPLEDSINVEFFCPSSIDVCKEGSAEFKVKNSCSPSVSDVVLLESPSGISYPCRIEVSSPDNFIVRLTSEIDSGQYRLYLKRGESKRCYGTLYLNIVNKIDFSPSTGTTIYGKVTAGDLPLVNVGVSDGKEVALTNADGIYELHSDKELGYVFVIIPSGYEVPTLGCFPQFWSRVKNTSRELEQIDFNLHKVENQDNYQLLIFGDMHLADRNCDFQQFSSFTREINSLISDSFLPTYALTLGDMTWDIYWKNFGLDRYKEYINKSIRGLPIFHTMGNHDNDYNTNTDLSAESHYRSIIAPTYYSFNIGAVHYVVLDDIDCRGYDGSTLRNYFKSITKQQFDWLENDLKYVSQDSPVILSVHAPVFKPVSNTDKFTYGINQASATRLIEILKGRSVHIVSGHTHTSFNAVKENLPVNVDIHEHNCGAICGSWWWSGYLTEGVNICPDGTPGGYGIWTISGNEISWKYKAIGQNSDYQFRAYDLNEIHFSMADVPDFPSNVSDKVKRDLQKYFIDYPESDDNEILVNVWNYNSGWSVEIFTEAGTKLEVEPVWAYDPLHISALTLKRFNKSTLTTTPNFITEKHTHFFKAKAPDSTTNLEIIVKDEFGNIYREKMYRPQKF